MDNDDLFNIPKKDSSKKQKHNIQKRKKLFIAVPSVILLMFVSFLLQPLIVST